ncbi:MAG: thioredoxin family protein [Bacteroidales bacterium]|nr:thioredoxin family protein [Bacteroidales bacterium]
MAALSMFAQENIKKPYSETLDAMQQIDDAVALAAKTNRYVLCQVGGNWCPWCLKFAHFVDTNAQVHQLIDTNFVYIHVNYSRGNKNPVAMKRLGNPGRFGYPVFVILNKEGEVIHIQNSAYLEEGNGYSVKEVSDCFFNWTPSIVEQ